MTVEEIYAGLSAHMVKGLMFHAQLADYYGFLGLCGYEKCHEHHFCEESKSFRKLHRYFISHFNRLIEDQRVEDPEAIPVSWYRYTRQDVDANTKRNAVKTAIEKWVSWERDTKSYYQEMYQELVTLGEIAAATKLAECIFDVDCELKYATKKHLNLLAADFDMGYILGQQDEVYEKYDRHKHN